MIINITYALFDTFGIIDTLVKGEPGNNPMTMVYKVYVDDFRGNDLGGSSAQSVVLMVLVLALTIFQFRLLSAAFITLRVKTDDKSHTDTPCKMGSHP